MNLLWDKLAKILQRSLQTGASLLLVFAVLSASMGIVVILATKPGWTTEQQVVHLQLFGGIVHLHEGNHTAHTGQNSSEVRYNNPTPGVLEQVWENQPATPSSTELVSYRSGQETAEFNSGTILNWLQLLSPKPAAKASDNPWAASGNFQRVVAQSALLPVQPYLELPLKPPQS